MNKKRAAKKAPKKNKAAPPKPKSKNKRKPAKKKGTKKTTSRKRAARKQERLSVVARVRSWVERAREGLGEFAERHQSWGRRAGHIIIFGVAAAAVVWLGQALEEHVRTADAFAIREVVIEGNERLDEMAVRQAAQLRIGANVFEVSPEEARNHLLSHPWVKKAEVSRKLPGQFRIALTERRPVALVALDQLYLVSEEGAVFKKLGVDDPANFPIITGVASESFYDDYDYRTEVLLQSLALLQDYEGAGLAKREPVSEIHFEAGENVDLFVGEDGMHIRLGVGQHRRKLRNLRRILDRLKRERARAAYVYLDNVRRPDRVTVRLLDPQ